MKILDILNKDNWIKKSLCLDSDGNECAPKDACSMCLYGAIWKNYSISNLLEWPQEIEDKLNAVVKKLGFDNYIKFNDHPDTTWEMMERVIKEAGV